MNRFGLIVFLFLFGSSISNAQSKPEWTKVFQEINQEVEQNSKAYSTLQHATQTIGHRLTGSANGAKAEQYAYDLLKTYGLDEVNFAPFEAESWSRGTLSVDIDNKNYKAVTLAHSPVKANVFEGIVDMGNGLEEDYIKQAGIAKGKIVFAALGILPGSRQGLNNLHRSEKTALAIKHGAAGIIFFNNAPGNILLTGTASVTGKLIPIPAVCISNTDGMAIKQILQSKACKAKISMTNFSGKIMARNVIGIIKGKSLPDEKIVIGGHLDSWDLATGANDNGIGSFSVIDIARTFSALHLRAERTIEFVLFMGEEEGLLGSKAYLNQSIKNKTVDNIRYMINLDMSNNPKGFTSTAEEDKALFTSIGNIAKQIDTSFNNTFSSGFDLHSDHQPFMLKGIPTSGVSGDLSKEVIDCYHADCDVFALVNEIGLKNTVQFTAMLLYGLADASSLLAKPLNDDVLREKLIQSNLKEPLKLAGEWRWKDR
ncbi:MAG: M28 family peptidase [Agriterribacter sp.]